MNILKLFRSVIMDEQGICSVEYTLMLAFFVIGILALVVSLGETVAANYDTGTAALQQAGGG